jgi:hypothetical protein
MLNETENRMAERGVVGSWKGELDPFEEERRVVGSWN